MYLDSERMDNHLNHGNGVSNYCRLSGKIASVLQTFFYQMKASPELNKKIGGAKTA
jgi:hypothetical protein